MISIVLNGDVEHFDKSRAVDVNDVPQGVLTTIATEKPRNDDDDQKYF